MNRFDYLKLALKADCHYRFAWVVSAFATVHEGPSDYRSDLYPYRIVNDPTGFKFWDPATQTLVAIEGRSAAGPLFQFTERLQVDAELCANAKTPVESSLGNLLYNLIALVYPFGDKIPYQTGRVDLRKLERTILKQRQELPKDGEARLPTGIYTDEYETFIDAHHCYLENFAKLCVVAGTAKGIQPAPGSHEYKAALVKEYGDRLNDPVEFVEFQGKLRAFDDAWLKDDPSNGIYLAGKTRDVARSALYLTQGIGMSFYENETPPPVLNSLSEGWPKDPKQLAAMFNNQRVGSFLRGSETENGGVTFKKFIRAIAGIQPVDTDCGTTLGMVRSSQWLQQPWAIGRWARPISGGEFQLAETVDPSASALWVVRSGMFCKLPDGGFCRHCLGERLFSNPGGIATGMTGKSGIILMTSMSAMHGKKLATARLTLKHMLR